MAEIEHYVDPLDKAHPRFAEVKDVKLSLLAKDVQLDGRTDLTEMTIGDAVAQVCTASGPDFIIRADGDRASSITRRSVISSPGPTSSSPRSVLTHHE